MSKQICIHIGTHKTATTSIQHLLCLARREIARRGIYVPGAGRTDAALAGHHNIAWNLRRDARCAPGGTLDDLVAELRRCRQPRAVISSEDFEYLVEYPEHIATLEIALRRAGWEPRYLLFLRDPADYAISLYREMAKHGIDMAFADFLDEVRARGYFRCNGDWTHYLDYATFIARWRAAATAPLHVRSYDDARRGPGVVEAFLSALTLPADTALLTAPEANTSWLRRLRYRLKGRALPSVPSGAMALNVSDGPVSCEMKRQAAALALLFPMPSEATAGAARPVFD